ncbi:MAG: hypothetical protein WCG97_01665 [bacterium]
MNVLIKSINYLKKETSVVLFFVVLISSWAAHISFRNEHFQEGDSSGTYTVMYDFPAATLRTTALIYPAGNFLSLDQAQSILKDPRVQAVRNKYLSSFSDEFLLNQLTKSSAIATFRYGLIQAVSILHLPFPIQSFFATGLGSTYSSGVGFIYGLIGGKNGTYADFMSHTMIISITLFHMAILLLFLINRKLGVRTYINVAISTVALFSISLYSSGIHIGSTVWNFTTELFWIWYLIKNINSPKLLRKMSWCSGILVFFNYLILFFWLSFIVTLLIEKVKKERQANPNSTNLRKVLGYSWEIVKQQKGAIMLIGLCGILFFQPGQGFRGAVHLIDLPANIYYIVLNFFSWYTHSTLFDIFQFIFGVLFIASGVFFLINRKCSESSRELWLARQIFICLIFTYIFLVCVQTLSFTPTRHILFLFPIIFITAGIGLEFLIRKINSQISKSIQIIFLASLSLLGFCMIKIRQEDSYDRTREIQIDKDVAMIGIYDSSYNIYYENLHSGVPVTFINPKTFKVGETYLYVSQSDPLEVAYKEWQVTYDIEIEKIWEKSDITEAYFVAHNPDFKNSRYSRPNNFYQTKFKVISIKQK